jgi:hypothetical protein
MEFLTKPDIEKYVYTRIGSSLAFQELRALYSTSIQKLESQIIERAEGVFLWVVLVTEKLLATAREYNDLHEIWKVFEDLPTGLEELYSSIRRRLDQAHRERASRMYQLLFRWNSIVNCPFGIVEFWMAINCRDPSKPQPSPTVHEVPGILPVMERRFAGATGGILQVLRKPVKKDKPFQLSQTTSVEFLHRTVFDWLRSIKSSIVDDGPPNYDPGLVLTSVLVSRFNCNYGERHYYSVGYVGNAFSVARSCNDSADSRAKLLVIIEQLQVTDGQNYLDRRYLGFDENFILSSYLDSAVRSFLATRSLCAPYLQAKLESASGDTGLELPRMLHMFPVRFWKKSRRELVSLLIGVLFNHFSRGAPQVQNMGLKTFEILLQARFAPRHVLRDKINKMAKGDAWPKEFIQALLDVLAGQGFKEITSIRRGEDVDDDGFVETARLMPWSRIEGIL